MTPLFFLRPALPVEERRGETDRRGNGALGFALVLPRVLASLHPGLWSRRWRHDHPVIRPDSYLPLRVSYRENLSVLNGSDGSDGFIPDGFCISLANEPLIIQLPI